MKHRGFTIAEIIIAITVIIILAAAAITGSAGLIRTLRFNNAFNKMIFMVQQARSLAVTGKGTAANYNVLIEMVPWTISIGSSTPPADTTILETLTLEATTNLEFFASRTGGACGTTAVIEFERGSGKTSLICDSVDPPPSSLTVGIREVEVEAGAERRSKTFSIHQAAGIPQIER